MLLVLVAFVARILLDPLRAIANIGSEDLGAARSTCRCRGIQTRSADLVVGFREMITAVRAASASDRGAGPASASSPSSAALRAKAEREHRRLQATVDTVPWARDRGCGKRAGSPCRTARPARSSAANPTITLPREAVLAGIQRDGARRRALWTCGRGEPGVCSRADEVSAKNSS